MEAIFWRRTKIKWAFTNFFLFFSVSNHDVTNLKPTLPVCLSCLPWRWVSHVEEKWNLRGWKHPNELASQHMIYPFGKNRRTGAMRCVKSVVYITDHTPEPKYYGKKASTGGNGLASPLPSHAEAYNHLKLQSCAAPDVRWLYPFIGVICLTSTAPLAWWWKCFYIS